MVSKVGTGGYSTPDRIIQNIFNVYSAIVTIISLILTLPLSYYWTAIFAIISAILGHYAMLKTNKARQEYYENTNLYKRRRDYYRNVCLTPVNLNELKIYDNGFFQNKYLKSKNDLYKKEMLLNFILNFWDSGFLQLKEVLCRIAYLFLVYDMCIGKLSVDYFILISVALENISDNLLWEFFYKYEWFKKVSINLDYMRRFFEIPTESVSDSSKNKPKSGGHTIKFENVSFKYDNTDIEVLDNINFKIESGQKVAIVGLNGSGKTTLIKLLLRLYQPTTGTIYLDEININNYEINEYRKLFGVIFQDYCKYAFSLKDNICFDENLNDKELNNFKNAINFCSLEEFINNLPEKELTKLTRFFEEDSLDISEGQWQKIALARALFFKNSFLIFDEPTSYFDINSEKVFFEKLFDQKDDCTTIIITHQLSIASRCDKIILINNGRLLESGSHGELMKMCGKYYEMYKKQSYKFNRNTIIDNKINTL